MRGITAIPGGSSRHLPDSFAQQRYLMRKRDQTAGDQEIVCADLVVDACAVVSSQFVFSARKQHQDNPGVAVIPLDILMLSH